jgi:hypothetical protein
MYRARARESLVQSSMFCRLLISDSRILMCIERSRMKYLRTVKDRRLPLSPAVRVMIISPRLYDQLAISKGSATV